MGNRDLAISMGKFDISITYQTSPRDRPLSAIRIRAAAGDPRRGWLTAGGADIAGRAGARRHSGQQARGRWRHPPGHVSAAAIVVAGRPPRPAADVICRFAPSGPKMPGAKTPATAITTSRCGWRRDRGGDRLRRDDHLYDFIVEIDHNTEPRIAGRGSAVFLHLARENFGPTAGCVSMTRSAMLRLLQPARTRDEDRDRVMQS